MLNTIYVFVAEGEKEIGPLYIAMTFLVNC